MPRPHSMRRRRRKRWQGRPGSERLAFIDETWIKTDMAALRGRGGNGWPALRRTAIGAPGRSWRRSGATG